MRNKETNQAKAQLIWDSLSDNEKTAIRFGLFPASRITTAEVDGFDGREICLALMDCAKANGGMKA